MESAVRFSSTWAAEVCAEGAGWVEMNPAIMAVTKEARIAAIAHLKAWRKAYREALDLYCAGNREVVFPIGTWRMHKLFDCNVAQAA
jgi:hypothetical protein